MLGNDNLASAAITWAVSTDFAYLKGKWFRVLLEVEGSASSFASATASAVLSELIRVPTMYTQPPRGFMAKDVTFCMAIVSRQALRLLVRGTGSGPPFQAFKLLVSKIKAIELGTPVLPFEESDPRVLKELFVDQPRTAIVAVIDDGIAFAHERFRKLDSNGKLATRFKYFWNQDDTTAAGLPPGFGYGRELAAIDIDTSSSTHTWSGIVDEEMVYRELGQKLAARRLKHGTHVMDIACGLDVSEVRANSPYLIGVQLPGWVTRDSSGGLLTPAALDALHFILNRADQIASDENTATLQVVANLSYGIIAGPHDGSSLLERAIDQLIASRATPLRMVFPVGNYHLLRCHASFDLAAGASRKLRWRIQPDDKAESRLDVWLPELTPSQYRPKLLARLTSPTGEVSPWVQPGGVFPPPSLGKSLYQISYVDTGVGRPQISFFVAPTAEANPSPRVAPCGTWLVELKNTGTSVAVETWIQRGDTPFGYPLAGRQSRFDDTNYVRFTPSGHDEENDVGSSSVRRAGTVNALATGQQTIAVGGYRRSDRKPSKYSGAGPVATPPIMLPRTGPDVSAVADDSVALHGIIAAGTRSGSVAAMDGTSVAAPQVTRLISEWMVQGMPSDRYAVQSFAAAKDPNAPAPGTKLQERLGAGRIDGQRPVMRR